MKNSQKVNLKKIPKDAQEFIRARAITLHKAGGYADDIARQLGISIRSVYRWIGQFNTQGEQGLKNKPHTGAVSRMSDAQLKQMVQIILEKNPSHFGSEFHLWTLTRIQAMIKKEFDISFSIAWIGVLLERLRLTPQRPKLVMMQQDKALVRHWRLEEHPALKARAQAEDAEIWFADEASFRSNETKPRTWGLVGHTPVVQLSADRGVLNVISAITSHGELEFTFVEGSVNSTTFGDFLTLLMTGRKKKIFLVVDNCSIHHAKHVDEVVKSFSGKLELIYLPAYSPDLNPDELVWAHAKSKVRAVAHQTKHEFKQAVRNAMHALQAQANLITSFVRHCYH